MQLHSEEDFSRFSLYHKYMKNLTARNIQLLIVGKAGHGKTLSAENIAEEFFRLGYVVIFLYDDKGEVEAGCSMFPPQEPYHLDLLKLVGKKPGIIPTKLYHPFTFDIKKNQKMPDFKLFTLNIKGLKREDFSMLVETKSDTDTIKLLLEGVQHLNKQQGMYELVHYLQDKVKRKETAHYGKRIYVPDWDNFGLTASFAGTVKDISSISSIFKPFQRDYCITPASCPYNLDVMDILNDNKHYHVFTTRYIDDEKMRHFITFHLFNLFEDALKYAKYPVVFVVEEIRNLVHEQGEGHVVFMTEGMRKKLSTVRNKGRGCSTISTTQVYTDVDSTVTNSMTETLIGNLGGIKDIEKTAKALKYSKSVVEDLGSLKEGTYLRKGHEDGGSITIWLPSHCHKEEHYNFFEMYKKYYPDKMFKPQKMYNIMKELLKSEKDVMKNKVKKKMKGVMAVIEKESKLKEKQENAKLQIEKFKSDKRAKAVDEAEYRDREIWRLREETEPPTSFEEIGELFGTTRQNIQKIHKRLKEEKAKAEKAEQQRERLPVL